MKRPLLNQKRLLGLLVALLLVASFLPLDTARLIATRPAGIVQATVAPVSHAFHTLSTSIRRPADNRGERQSYEKLLEDRDSALRYSRQLEEDLREAQEWITQISQVRQRLSLTGTELLPASVTGSIVDASRSNLRINRGTRDGVNVGMVAASGFSVVGRVGDAGRVASEVRLINTPGTKLSVRIMPGTPGPPVRETLVQAQVARGGKVFEAVIPQAETIAVGDLAHLADDSWPAEARGLVVGQVVRIEPWSEQPYLRNLVVIQPVVPLPALPRVVVIIPDHGRAQER